ncbi:MAG: NADH-quinone oxidoreductase subunit C [Desulfuromonas sp.]|nr:NADH-quinone oxidoreductase subunit C [Desulfuromonas sp.]
MDVKQVVKQWNTVATEVAPVDYAVCGYDYDVAVTAGKIHELAEVMLQNGFYLVDLMAVDVKPAIEVVYQFAHVETRCRVMARAFVENNEIPTISDVYQGANWHERETRDFHGVVFVGHPNLEPLILAEEDVDLKPLLKDEKSILDVAAIRRVQPETESAAAKSEASKSQEQS